MTSPENKAIERMQRAARRSTREAKTRSDLRVDIGIITIREDENRAVLRRFEPLATEDGRRRYRIRRLDLPGGGSYRIAVVRCLDQGNSDAQSAADALLSDLAPRLILVVGIAGAVPAPELTLGDVVVSSGISDFSVEAVLHGNETEYALRGGPLHPFAALLAADLPAMDVDGELGDWNTVESLTQPMPTVLLEDDRLYGDESWKRRVRDSINRRFGTGRMGPPRAMSGAIAASNRLVKDDELLAVWLRLARQVVAVEMESAGVYKATQTREVPFLAIRGISDVVGLKRDPDWTAYACETAAAFTHAFLRTRPLAL